MRRSLLALISAGLLAITLVAPASAITGNYVEDFEHPFVGLIAFYDDAGVFSHRCSGSLIAPRVFLTAGHCTADDSTADSTDVMASARIWFRQDAGAEFNGTIDPRTGYPNSCINDPNFPDAQEQCVTATEMYNYGFDNFAGFPNTRDVGVVILDRKNAVTLPEYGSIAPAATITSNKSVELTVSGYGISDGHASSDPTVSFRERLMATTTLITTNDTWTDGYNLKTQPNGGGRGGTCSGDSGGPVFYPSTTNQIVAVTSFGRTSPNACQGSDYSYRLDRPEVIAWIDSVAGRLWNP